MTNFSFLTSIVLSVFSSLSPSERRSALNLLKKYVTAPLPEGISIPKLIKGDANAEDLTKVGHGLITTLLSSIATGKLGENLAAAAPSIPRDAKLSFVGAPPSSFVVPVSVAFETWNSLSEENRAQVLALKEALDNHQITTVDFEEKVIDMIDKVPYAGSNSTPTQCFVGAAEDINYTDLMDDDVMSEIDDDDDAFVGGLGGIQREKLDDTAHQKMFALGFPRDVIQRLHQLGSQVSNDASAPDFNLSSDPFEGAPPSVSDTHSTPDRSDVIVFGSPVAAALYYAAKIHSSKLEGIAYKGFAVDALAILGMMPNPFSAVRNMFQKSHDNDFKRQLRIYKQAAATGTGVIPWAKDEILRMDDNDAKRPLVVWWNDWIFPLLEALTNIFGKRFVPDHSFNELTMEDFEQGKKISDQVVKKMLDSTHPKIAGLVQYYTKVMDRAANVMDDEYFMNPYSGGPTYSGGPFDFLKDLFGKKDSPAPSNLEQEKGTVDDLAPVNNNSQGSSSPFSVLKDLLGPSDVVHSDEGGTIPTNVVSDPQIVGEDTFAPLNSDSSSPVLIRYYVGAPPPDDYYYYSGGLFKKIGKFVKKAAKRIAPIAKKVAKKVAKVAKAVSKSKLGKIASFLPGPVGLAFKAARAITDKIESASNVVNKVSKKWADSREDSVPPFRDNTVTHVPNSLQIKRLDSRALADSLKGVRDPRQRMGQLLAYARQYPDHPIGEVLERKRIALVALSKKR